MSYTHWVISAPVSRSTGNPFRSIHCRSECSHSGRLFFRPALPPNHFVGNHFDAHGFSNGNLTRQTGIAVLIRQAIVPVLRLRFGSHDPHPTGSAQPPSATIETPGQLGIGGKTSLEQYLAKIAPNWHLNPGGFAFPDDFQRYVRG
jgi:hypothetical protein